MIKHVFIIIYLILCTSCSTKDDANGQMPSIFALNLIGTKKYASLAFDGSNDLVIRNYEVEIPELFEKVLAPISVSLGSNKHFTIFCMRSVFNEKFFIIDNRDHHKLKAKEFDIDKAEKFIIYYGPNKNIGLKSLRTDAFVKTESINNDTVLTCAPELSDDALVGNQLAFAYEYFESPVDYEFYDVDSINKPQVKIAPIEKLKFPKKFALKSKLNGYNIGVDSSQPHNVYTRSELYDNWETFEVLYLPAYINGSEEMFICLKCLGNNMFLSAKIEQHDKLIITADSNECGDTEKFKLFYGKKNVIGLKSELSNKFLGSPSNPRKPLAFDQNQFMAFEIIKVFDQSHLPRLFALQSVANGRYLCIEDKSSKLLKANSLNEGDGVVFMYILFTDESQDKYQNKTIISIQSKLTNTVLSVRDQDLIGNVENVTDNEKFMVYHGANDIIGLKSISNGLFIGADYDKDKPLMVNRRTFDDWEMFKVVEIIEKYTFPKLFSLRAKSNGYFIQIETNNPKVALKANSDASYEKTAFEVIIYPGSQKEDDNFIVILRSMFNGKLLTVENNLLFANAVSLSDKEKFYVYYGLNNVIGLKSKANGKYLSSNPNTKRDLMVDRTDFDDWEMFEIVPY